MNATQRLWRTTDGRLVPDGHLDARQLAYAPGDEIPAADREKAGQAAKAKPAAAEQRDRSAELHAELDAVRKELAEMTERAEAAESKVAEQETPAPDANTEAKPNTEPEAKAAATPANKARRPAANKANTE